MKTLTTLIISLLFCFTGYSQKESIKIRLDRVIVKNAVINEGFFVFEDTLNYIMFVGETHSSCYLFDKDDICYQQSSIYIYDYLSEILVSLNNNLILGSSLRIGTMTDMSGFMAIRSSRTRVQKPLFYSCRSGVAKLVSRLRITRFLWRLPKKEEKILPGNISTEKTAREM